PAVQDRQHHRTALLHRPWPPSAPILPATKGAGVLVWERAAIVNRLCLRRHTSAIFAAVDPIAPSSPLDCLPAVAVGRGADVIARRLFPALGLLIAPAATPALAG